jgi:hypothetical protein
MSEKVKKKTIKKTNTDMIPKGNGIDSLISQAIKSKSSVENLKELMKMKYEYEGRGNKKRWQEAFCKMQSELPVITKSKAGAKMKSGQVAYYYAPLEKIIETIKPILLRYNFSYKWSEEFVEKGIKRIVCHLSGYGHEETSHVDLPIMEAGSMTNKIQQYGSSITYGKRYSLIGLLGLMADTDDDGASAEKKKSPIKPKSNWGSRENKVFDNIKKACQILGINGLQLLKQIQLEKPEVKVLQELKYTELVEVQKALNIKIDQEEKK